MVRARSCRLSVVQNFLLGLELHWCSRRVNFLKYFVISGRGGGPQHHRPEACSLFLVHPLNSRLTLTVFEKGNVYNDPYKSTTETAPNN
jgi:hypothetical protein